jgi:hypothetical protein
MSSGFNTDVRVGDQIFHVQTEDRGPARPVIDTVVYQNGRVLHRRSSSYQHFADSTEFTPEGVRERVDEQHRSIIEDLRSGMLLEAIAAAAEKAKSPAIDTAIQIQLLNSGSWLSAGRVSLDVEILRKADRQPQPGAQVEAVIEGALRDGRHEGLSDDQGRAHIEFPLPQLGKGDLALVILAKADQARDELRFAMRSRSKVTSPSGSSC